MNRGFTVVEVLVTLVVISILLGLGTVGLRSTLANARDAERKSDIEVIARALEARYNKGSTYTWMEDTNGDGTPELQTATHPAGTYPGNNELWDTIYWSNRARIGEILPGVSDAAVNSPSNERITSPCIFYMWNLPACDAAEKDSNIQAQFSNGSGGWKDIYIYEFIGPNGGYCNVNECTRYNLYWISETDPTVYKGIPGLKVWKSKHR